MNSTTINFKALTFFFILVFICGINSHVNAKQISKSTKLQQKFKPNDKPAHKSYIWKSKNEIETTGAILFVGYKSFVSSQDMGSCVFTPSCSAYAIQTLQHDKPFEAYLKIFDRLTRCHPLVKPGTYELTKDKMHYYDPAY